MPRTILPKLDKTQLLAIQADGLAKAVETTGRLPPISLQIIPLVGTPFYLDRFLNYSFTSSVLVPVEGFQFDFAAPDQETPFNQIVKEGDLVRLYANGVALCSGIIDQTDVEVDPENGEVVRIQGRNIAGQLEDQDAVNPNSGPIWGNSLTPLQVGNALAANTRIQRVITRNMTTKPYLFATEPGESKLAALSRYLEPLNALMWVDEVGNLVMGKPNMSQPISGTIFCSRAQRAANTLSIKAVRSAATIPNFIIPIWQGQESVVDRVSKQQGFKNAAKGPARLYRNNHILPKTIVVSTPQGATAQDLSGVNQLKIGAGNLLEAYAKRELARANQKELLVQAVMPGHYNEKGEKYHVDHTYRVLFDRGDVDEIMYLYEVQYKGGEGSSQKTVLNFCRLGTIVADVPVP